MRIVNIDERELVNGLMCVWTPVRQGLGLAPIRVRTARRAMLMAPPTGETHRSEKRSSGCASHPFDTLLYFGRATPPGRPQPASPVLHFVPAPSA